MSIDQSEGYNSELMGSVSSSVSHSGPSRSKHHPINISPLPECIIRTSTLAKLNVELNQAPHCFSDPSGERYYSRKESSVPDASALCCATSREECAESVPLPGLEEEDVSFFSFNRSLRPPGGRWISEMLITINSNRCWLLQM